MNKRFNLSEGGNYWNKYEEYVELYNARTLTLPEIRKKLDISKNKMKQYYDRGIQENQLKIRRGSNNNKPFKIKKKKEGVEK